MNFQLMNKTNTKKEDRRHQRNFYNTIGLGKNRLINNDINAPQKEENEDADEYQVSSKFVTFYDYLLFYSFVLVIFLLTYLFILVYIICGYMLYPKIIYSFITTISHFLLLKHFYSYNIHKSYINHKICSKYFLMLIFSENAFFDLFILLTRVLVIYSLYFLTREIFQPEELTRIFVTFLILCFKLTDLNFISVVRNGVFNLENKIILYFLTKTVLPEYSRSVSFIYSLFFFNCYFILQNVRFSKIIVNVNDQNSHCNCILYLSSLVTSLYNNNFYSVHLIYYPKFISVIIIHIFFYISDNYISFSEILFLYWSTQHWCGGRNRLGLVCQYSIFFLERF